MKNPKYFLVSMLILSAILLGACNYPTLGGEEDADATTVASTTVAVFTRAAETAAVTLPTATTAPEATALPTNTIVPTIPPATATNTPIPCNRASFMKDVTYADNTEVLPNTVFTKTWRIKNNGSCTWTSSYVLLFDSGDQMGAPATASITSGTVAPGATVDISVDLTAPASPGTYQGKFKLRSGDNIVFGINADGQGPFWVKVVVPAPTPVPTDTSVPTLPPPPPPIVGDLSIIQVFLSTHAEVVVRVDTNPTGSLSGNFGYKIYANSSPVAQGSCAVPTGSSACWTGYTVVGSQTIQVVIDYDNAYNETNESNNTATVNCNSSTLACN